MAGHDKTQTRKIAENLTRRQLLELEACTRCGECLMWCPVHPHDMRESVTARGKLAALRRMLGKGLDEETRRDFLEGLYECSACGQCHIVCPVRINTPELWEQTRRALACAGLPQPEAQAKQLRNIKQCNNSHGKPQAERGLWAELAAQNGFIRSPLTTWRQRRAPVLYFAGCAASFDPAIQSVAVQSARLLQEAGVDFSILGNEEPCCASKLRRMGDLDFEMEAGWRADRLAGLKAETLVASCAGCYKGLYSDYRKLWPNVQRVVHMSQFLLDLMRQGRLTPRYEVRLKVTYHDPCHLGRHNRIYEEPRDVLRLIPGIELIEMPRHAAFSACCGMGGGLKVAFLDLQHRMAAARIREAEAVGVEAVVTPCQTCCLGLQNGVKETSSSLEVLHLNEILIRSICPDVTHRAVLEAFGYAGS